MFTGHYCTEGTANPYKCPPGESQLNIGQSQCLPCRKGYYCPVGANDANPIICPPFSYCPSGSYEPTRCPNGTYTLNTTTGYESVSQCRPCIPGYYCRWVISNYLATTTGTKWLLTDCFIITSLLVLFHCHLAKPMWFCLLERERWQTTVRLVSSAFLVQTVLLLTAQLLIHAPVAHKILVLVLALQVSSVL